MNNEELQNIANQIKAGLGIEILDQLEREYNEMYQKLKSKQTGSLVDNQSSDTNES